jgi:hypothetical protein
VIKAAETGDEQIVLAQLRHLTARRDNFIGFRPAFFA